MGTIDGTEWSDVTIDGDEVQEITVDGDVVYTAQTIIEDFEWGGPLTDRYSAGRGDIDNWSLDTSSPVFQGSYSLKYDGPDDGTQGIDIEPTAPNPRPTMNDKIHVWLRLIDSDGSPLFGVLYDATSVDYAGDDDSFAVELNGRDSEFVMQLDGSQSTSSHSWSTGKWYLVEMDMSESGGTMNCTATVYDGDTTNHSVIASLSDSTSNTDRGDYFGWGERRDRGHCAFGMAEAFPGEGDP